MTAREGSHTSRVLGVAWQPGQPYLLSLSLRDNDKNNNQSDPAWMESLEELQAEEFPDLILVPTT